MPSPPVSPQHPGEVLLDWIVESGHTQVWLAEQTGSSVKHINHIVRGRSLYSEELALQLGDVTDRPAEFWSELRSKWRLAEAQRKRRDDAARIKTRGGQTRQRRE